MKLTKAEDQRLTQRLKEAYNIYIVPSYLKQLEREARQEKSA